MNSNSHINHGEAVYIINSEGIAYHPQLVAVYHQAAGGFIHGFAVMRYSPKGADEIQGWRAALDDIHDCVVMICHCFRNG